MITLGVCTVGDEHAAAIASGGAVLSAVSTRNVTAEVRSCVDEVLALAGVGPDCLDQILSAGVNGIGNLSDDVHIVDPHEAMAAQLRAVRPSPDHVVVVDDADVGRVVTSRSSGMVTANGSAPALRTLARAATALGLSPAHPVAALESIAAVGPASPVRAEWRSEDGGLSPWIDDDAVTAMIDAARARVSVPLDTAHTPHLPTQRIRGEIAASVLESLATLVTCAAERERSLVAGNAVVGFAGDAFRSPAFAARVRGRLHAIVIAPVHGASAGALGAALLAQPRVEPLRHLALGRSYSDQEIKAVLDNCRLEYLYEPDWPRLVQRTSRLLSTGALIGWFQGRAEFGGVSLGSRSILCDPSSRYSRENVNVFLLDRPLHAPLHVSLAPAQQRSERLGFEYRRAADLDGPPEKLVSAIDRNERVLCHVPDSLDMPELSALLDAHYQRTKVPGLLNVPMMSNGALAETPRQAIRETFASSTDALVIGRFVVAKDHWLLRQ